ncbi:MAG: OmpA family protein [Bacteroidia bacterium]
MKHVYLLFLVFTVNLLNAQTEELRPTKEKALLEVIVVNADKSSSEGEKVSFVATKTGTLYGGITNAEGKFSILVPKADKYKVKYKNFTEDKDYKTLDIPAEPELINFTFTIMVKRGKNFTLDHVFFDTGKSSLRAESNKALDALAEFMTNKKKMKIEIGGHTDNVGDKTANEKLSYDRANSVRSYLVKKGIAADRVTAKGYGDSQPVDDNSTPEGRQKNRRTEIKVLSE